jgi:outer membrane protein assembly factor BamB
VFSIYFGTIGPDFDIGAAANLFELNGKDVIGISIKSGDYAVLERETGTQVWTQHISSGSSMGGMIASSAYADGMIFVASNAFPGEQSTVAALDAKDGTIAWKQTITGGLVYGGVLHSNGVVYVGSSSSALVAYEAKTGKQLWTKMAQDAIAGGPCIAHGMLFVPWGYTWTLREGEAGNGGLTAYGLK